MIIKFSKTFVKQRNKASKKIQQALNKKIEIFIEDDRNPILRIHKLRGLLKDYYSMNITGDWRVVFKVISKNEIVIFLMFGTHSNLYK